MKVSRAENNIQGGKELNQEHILHQAKIVRMTFGRTLLTTMLMSLCFLPHFAVSKTTLTQECYFINHSGAEIIPSTGEHVVWHLDPGKTDSKDKEIVS